MTETIDPKEFGLHHSTRIEMTGKNHYTLVIDRKGRIIMKDGIQILSKMEKVKHKVGAIKFEVRTSVPVCGKTKAFLKNHGIAVISQ